MAGVTEQVEMYYRSVLDQLNGGERLPSERAVMEELNTCRSTVRLVLTKLAAQELLYPIHGRGYFKV
jgi:DNA-binding GntR family transcriptional regulator